MESGTAEGIKVCHPVQKHHACLQPDKETCDVQVERVEQAGAVFAGKSYVNEFGMGAVEMALQPDAVLSPWYSTDSRSSGVLGSRDEGLLGFTDCLQLPGGAQPVVLQRLALFRCQANVGFGDEGFVSFGFRLHTE
jgi:hypothetical protein